MKALHLSLAGLAALMAWSLAGAALAGDPDCIWFQAPQANRQALLEGANDQPTPMLFDSQADSDKAYIACGVTDATAPAARQGLTFYMVRKRAEYRLEHDYGKSNTDLFDAWDAEPREVKDAFEAKAVASGGDEFDTELIGRVCMRLNISSADGCKWVAYALIAMALELDADSRF